MLEKQLMQASVARATPAIYCERLADILASDQRERHLANQDRVVKWQPAAPNGFVSQKNIMLTKVVFSAQIKVCYSSVSSEIIIIEEGQVAV